MKCINLYITVVFLIFALFPESLIAGGEDSTTVATITVTGDLMCHSVQYEYAQVAADSFNFKPVFRLVKDYLSSSDFTYANLETVTAGKKEKYSGYPRFNTPDSYIEALKDAGFCMVTAANNHLLDRGSDGLIRTLKILDMNGINYTGAFASQKDRDSIRIFNIKGIKLAILAYTYGTNGNKIPKNKSFLTNLIDYNLMKTDIANARALGSEIILVNLHYGTEYKRLPGKDEEDAVDSLQKFGADIIIGGHPHVIQPMKFFKSENPLMDSGFVAYSMGNFISNQRWRYSDAGVILTLTLKKNFSTGKISISKFDFTPTWVFKGNTGRGDEFVIIPSQYLYTSDVLNHLSGKDFSNMIQSFSDTNEILMKYFERPGKTSN